MSIVFEKATRAKSKARIAVTGPSGSRKTLSALYLAFGIAGSWDRVALIDTEHERARFYANREDLGVGGFLWAPMEPPYSPERYIAYVKSAAEAVGSDGVVIVDSFSHAWDNEGGVLDIKRTIAKKAGKNDYTAWDEAGRIQNRLVNTILSVDCHTVVTLRAKTAYIIEEDERGRKKPVKIGLAPVQRENTEYEFDVVFRLDRSHTATLSKDTTFLDTWTGVINTQLGRQLGEWLNEGVEPPRCECCGAPITSCSGRTVRQIVEGTVSNYGQRLCIRCAAAFIKRQKESQAPDGTGSG